MKRMSLDRSRFLETPDRPRVHVAGGREAYANAREALAAFDLSPARGKRVLLKPNAGRIASPGSGITTDPGVVAAAIDAFGEAGAEVAVGESPIMGVAAAEAFEADGIAEVARERGCPLIDMDRRPFVEVPVPGGIAVKTLRVCPEVLEHDIVVSIPVMKMHMHTGVSLSVKNMKGCLWRRCKVDLHMLPPVEGSDEKPIDVAIADMAGVLRPHFAIIDGTVGMEGLGPSAGEAKPLGAVVAGADAFSADAAACELMGRQAATVPHLRLGAERGYGVIDLGRVAVTPANWRDRVSPFAPPPRSLSIEFPNVDVRDEQSCSACQSTLLLFLKRYGDRIFDYFTGDRCVCFAIGKGNEGVPEGTVCVGNCAARHGSRGIFVPGCPPVASEILHAVSGKPAVDSKDGHSRI